MAQKGGKSIQDMKVYLLGKYKERSFYSALIRADGAPYSSKTAEHFVYTDTIFNFETLNNLAYMLGMYWDFDLESGMGKWVEKTPFEFREHSLPGYIVLKHNVSPFFVLCFNPTDLFAPLSMVYTCLPNLCRNRSAQLFVPLLIKGFEFYTQRECTREKRKKLSQMVRRNIDNHPERFLYAHLSCWEEFLETYEPNPFHLFDQDEIG